MWITHTFFSRTLDREETVQLLMPHPRQVKGDAYTRADLYEDRRRLPVLIAMGDTGTESSWWLRHSFAEGDVHRFIAAVVCVRGMPAGEETLRFLREELPVLLCAQYPLDGDRMAFLGWQRSDALSGALAGSGIRALTAEPSGDCAAAMEHALKQLTEEDDHDHADE